AATLNCWPDRMLGGHHYRRSFDESTRSALPCTEGDRNIVGDESREIGQCQHVTKGDRHPPPAAGLASNYGQRGSTLWRKNIPSEHCERSCETPFTGECLADLFRSFLTTFDGIDGTQGGNRNFASRHAGDQGDADLPVESDRRQNRLERIADHRG